MPLQPRPRLGQFDIYLMRLAPEGPKNVPVKLTKNTRLDPNGPPSMYDQYPEWSPDGTQVVFQSQRTGNYEIFRIRATDGANPTNLTDNAAVDFDAEWQPVP